MIKKNKKKGQGISLHKVFLHLGVSVHRFVRTELLIARFVSKDMIIIWTKFLKRRNSNLRKLVRQANVFYVYISHYIF